MLSKVEKNKRAKEESLYEAAYQLFVTKGINETAISDIVKKAGVGKGTFYLYFKDKYDILDKIILDKSALVLSEAIRETSERIYQDPVDEVIFFVDYIIEYLKENKLLLKLMYKNLSWGVFKKAYEDYDEIYSITNMFERVYLGSNIAVEEIRRRLFMIIELTGSVTYSCIVLKEPDDIDKMKASLFNMIRRMI